jgi:hypothetical protein
MPAKRKAASGSRKRLKPAAEKRGLDAAQIVLACDAPEVAPLVAEVQARRRRVDRRLSRAVVRQAAAARGAAARGGRADAVPA